MTTARLLLREWTEADRPAFAHLVNTPAMTVALGGLASPAEVDALFDKRMADQARDGFCYWAAELRASGEMVGSVGIRAATNYTGTPVFGMIEAGWRIGESWWRRGFAIEAASAAIAWAWANLDAPRVGAWATAANLPSLSVMGRLGFVRAVELDFDRPESGERCLVHVLERPARGAQ
ncbi:MAG: GNAT family N-acetyltransferase [Novosphingobium sp.]|nr:GNAT family N-acetyltransferase [Novosphingobium sp.]